MKYIKFENTGMIIFPRSCQHNNIKKLFKDDKVISAGFAGLKEKEALQCFGESFSLKIGKHFLDNQYLYDQFIL